VVVLRGVVVLAGVVVLRVVRLLAVEVVPLEAVELLSSQTFSATRARTSPMPRPPTYEPVPKSR
jgi:hypothetical protein